AKDAKVNIQNHYGAPALHIAACNGHNEVVKLLLAKDAKVNIQNHEGATDLQIAAQKGNKKVYDLLAAEYKKKNIPIPECQDPSTVYVSTDRVEDEISTNTDTLTYNMSPAMTVFNLDAGKPRVRNCVIEYPDPTNNLSQKEYIPSRMQDVQNPGWNQAQIDDFKNRDPNQDGLYYSFSCQLPGKGKKVRILSTAIDEELVACRAKNNQDQDVKITIERGDDDFFYISSPEECKLDLILKAKKEQQQIEQNYNNIPKDNPICQAIDDYISSPEVNTNTERNISDHNQFMEDVYHNKQSNDPCRFRTFAMVHHIATKYPELKDDIRTVHIDGNHAQVEMRHNGKWVACPDLGGTPSNLQYSKTPYIPTVLDANTSNKSSASSSLKPMSWRRQAKSQPSTDDPSQATTPGQYQPKTTSKKPKKPSVLSYLNPMSCFRKSKSPPRPDDPSQATTPEQNQPSKEQDQPATSEVVMQAVLSQIPPDSLSLSNVVGVEAEMPTSFKRVDDIDSLCQSVSESVSVSQQASGKRKNILINSSNGETLDNITNALLQSEKAKGRAVFVIDSPDDIDIAKRTLRCNKDGSATLRDKGHLESFLEQANDAKEPPLLIIRGDQFSAQAKVQHNDLWVNDARAAGYSIPDNVRIVTLDALSSKEINESKAYISRHASKFSFPADTKEEVPALDEGKKKVINLEGFPNWQEALFGPVRIYDNKIKWEPSDFVKNLADGTDTHFEIINIDEKSKNKLNRMLKRAQAEGAFHYHGFDIPVPEGARLACSERSMDFSSFDNYKLQTGSSLEDTPDDAIIINTNIFDRLLGNKEIQDGVYTTKDGLIAENQNKTLPLVIASDLSDNQWYCLLSQAKKHNVTLEIYTSNNVNRIPEGVIYSTISKSNGTKERMVLPKVAVTTDPQKELDQEQYKDSVIVRIEDLTSMDVYHGVPHIAPYDIGSEAYNKEFSVTISPLIDKLKQEKKVILTGEFSSTMLDELTPLFEQNIDNIQNLTLLIEGEEIPPQLSFLPSDAYQIIPRKQSQPTQEQKETNHGWREETPNHADFDLSNSTQKTTEFLNTRLNALRDLLAVSPIVCLESAAGAGKSKLVEQLGKNDNFELHQGLDGLKTFLQQAKNSSDKMHLISLDESKTTGKELTQFAALLETDPAKRTMLVEGEIVDIPANVRFVTMDNPAFDSNGRRYANRRVPKIQSQYKYNIPMMYLGALPPVCMYETALAPLRPENYPEDKFKQAAQGVLRDIYQNNSTPREAQEKMLHYVASSLAKGDYPKEASDIESNFFVSTTDTDKVQLGLEQSIALRRLQHNGKCHDCTGQPCVIIEGEPGLGKSEMVRAALAAQDIEQIGKDSLQKLDETDKQYFIKIPASMAREQKRELLSRAQQNGHIVWIDEINSCLSDGFEKDFNLATTGVNPITGKEGKNKAGFLLIATANAASYDGRSIIGEAILSRSTSLTMLPWEKYDDQSLKKIAQHAGYEINVEFINAIRQAPNIHNIRDFLAYLDAPSSQEIGPPQGTEVYSLTPPSVHHTRLC
ncbi:MAG: ankyrin repeat domain-containing protein, partial [Pseudomonadota bacterium]